MIVQYEISTLRIFGVILGSDADTVANWTATSPAGMEVFTTTDDPNVTDNKSGYYVTESSPGVPTGLAQCNVIGLSSASYVLIPSDVPTINLQLYQPDGTTPLTSVETITLDNSGGILSSPSVTTNGSGVASFTLRPLVDSATIIASATGFVSGEVNFTISVPSTVAEQNWIESNDIKDEAVDGSKIASGTITPDKISSVLAGGIGGISFSSNCTKVNSIVVDANYIYANALDGSTPTVFQFYRDGFVTTGASTTYTNNNLANGFDGLMDDGTDLWLASGADLVQITKSTMAIANTFTVGAGDNLEFLLNDGANIWSYTLVGADAGHVMKIRKADGVVLGFANMATAGLHIKQASIYGTYVIVNLRTTNAWAGIERTTFVITPEGPGANIFATLAINNRVWMTLGAEGTSMSGVFWDAVLTSSLTPLASAYSPLTGIGKVWDLVYDDNNIWGIASVDHSSNTKSAIRELFPSFRYVSDNPIIGTGTFQYVDVGRSVDVTTIASGGSGAITPSCLCYKDNTIYVGCFQSYATNPYNAIFFKVR